MQYSSGITKCSINVRDPVKTFYIKTNKELNPNTNYYMLLLINGQIISFTNKFNKNIINNVSVYEVDLFAKKITLPFCDLLPEYQTIEFIGVDYNNKEDINIDIFEEIFYEKDTEYTTKNTGYELLIYFHDSELANLQRKYCKRRREVYGDNVDNVLRVIDGMMGIAYSLYFPWGDDDPRLVIDKNRVY